MPRRLTTVFLDRDGVINRRRPEGAYVERWEQFEFLPGAVEALRLLTDAGLRLIVVTNQRGVALGRMSRQDVDEIHRRMSAAVGQAGARVAAVFVCPHGEGECDCRKPGLGLFRQAQQAFPDLDLRAAAVVGDEPADMQAGARLGTATYLVEAAPRPQVEGPVRPDGTAPSLLAVAERYLLPRAPAGTGSRPRRR